MKLSIGQAWDETKRILRADGSAIVAIALALLVLPGAILETVAPSSLRAADMPFWLSLVGLISALLSLIGQLAISRIAVGPATTVGSALGQGFRRLPATLGAVLLIALPMIFLIGIVAASQGVSLEQQQAIGGALLVPFSLMALVYIYIFLRMIFITPLAIDSQLGPIGLIKTSWRLTAGRAGKLFLLLLTVLLLVLVLIVGLGGALSAVIILALGVVTPGSLSAVLVALIQQVLTAIISVLFVTVVCRLYVQAKGGAAPVSVPHAGGE